jgi:hypothetical protein
MEPFQSTKSGRIRLLISICTFCLPAPIPVEFRKEHCLNQDKRINELVISQNEEEKKN